MSKRTINIHDGPNGTPDPGPQTMEDLLNAAQSMWKKGDRQRAFVTLLGAVAFCSKGVAIAMRNTEELKARLDAITGPPNK